MGLFRRDSSTELRDEQAVTSRERVRAAITHQEPDRVPIDLGGMRSTNIMAKAYNRLTDYLGLSDSETFVYDATQCLAQPEDAILERFDIDVIDLGRAFFTRPEERRPFQLKDGTPVTIPAGIEAMLEPDGNGGWLIRGDEGQVIATCPLHQDFFSQTYWPLGDGITEEKLADLPYQMSQSMWAKIACAPHHQPMTDEWLAEIAHVARKLREETDYAIMVAFGGNLNENAQFLRGFDRFLMDLAGDPRSAHRLLDQLTEVHLANLERFLTALGPYIDIIQMGDDLGTQTGPQFSPQMYREFFLPRHKQIYTAVKQHSDAFVFMHNCGGVYELIPMLIEAGVEILNPVQTSARNMEPERLKREFGRDLCFWGGGCETQSTLVHGTPAQVIEEVKRRVEVFGAGGGYVFTQVHNILSDVPPQNVVAMLEAAHQ